MFKLQCRGFGIISVELAVLEKDSWIQRSPICPQIVILTQFLVHS